MDRRRALDILARSAAVIAVPSLGACGSSTAHRDSEIGTPIPSDPVVRTSPRTRHVPVPQTSEPFALPGVITRRTWATEGPRTWLADPMGGIDKITVHHDGMTSFTSTTSQSSARRIESIRRGHTGNGWADIGYHYAVDPAGRVWQGRPLHLQGAHVKASNPHNLGICVLGNYERQQPSAATVRSLEDLIATEMRRHGVRRDRVFTHRELAATACPGRSLQDAMNRTRASTGRLSRA